MYCKQGSESAFFSVSHFVFACRSSPSVAKVPPTPPKRAGSTLSTVNHSDEVRVYEVEDTPVDLSEKSSFSDLTVDEPQSGRVSVDSNDGLIEHHPEDQSQNQRY